MINLNKKHYMLTKAGIWGERIMSFGGEWNEFIKHATQYSKTHPHNTFEIIENGTLKAKIKIRAGRILDEF